MLVILTGCESAPSRFTDQSRVDEYHFVREKLRGVWGQHMRLHAMDCPRVTPYLDAIRNDVYGVMPPYSNDDKLQLIYAHDAEYGFYKHEGRYEREIHDCLH